MYKIKIYVYGIYIGTWAYIHTFHAHIHKPAASSEVKALFTYILLVIIKKCYVVAIHYRFGMDIYTHDHVYTQKRSRAAGLTNVLGSNAANLCLCCYFAQYLRYIEQNIHTEKKILSLWSSTAALEQKYLYIKKCGECGAESHITELTHSHWLSVLVWLSPRRAESQSRLCVALLLLPFCRKTFFIFTRAKIFISFCLFFILPFLQKV